MEELLTISARYAATLIEAGAVFVVAYASLEAFVRVLLILPRPNAVRGERKAVWQRYGTWLLLGLEFELAADIIRSVVAPTRDDLIELATIAVIRTFLNYFLEKDLDHAAEQAEAGRSPGP